MLGANLGAIRRISPQTVMDAPGHIHSDYRDPLLLIAGQAVTHHAWDPVLDCLSQQHQVLTFDHRGTANSSLGDTRELTTQSLALDALAVLDAAGLEQAHIFGHSLGGRIAQWVAIEHADRLGALILGATTAGDRRGQPRTARATAALLSGDPTQLGPLFFTPDLPRPEHTNAIFATAGETDTLRRFYRASQAHDAWDYLHRIAAHTLVQHGADDPITPPHNAKLLAAAVPHGQLQLFPALRHGYYLQSPEALTAVRHHLGEHEL